MNPGLKRVGASAVLRGRAVDSGAARRAARSSAGAWASQDGTYRVLVVGTESPQVRGAAIPGTAWIDTLGEHIASLKGCRVVVDYRLATDESVRAVRWAVADVDLIQVDALVLVLRSAVRGLAVTQRVSRVADLVEGLWRALVPGSTVTVVMGSPSVTDRIGVGATRFTSALRGRVNALIRVLQTSNDADSLSGSEARGRLVAVTVAGDLLDPVESYVS